MAEIWAFDFDGVICDSAAELCIACWKVGGWICVASSSKQKRLM